MKIEFRTTKKQAQQFKDWVSAYNEKLTPEERLNIGTKSSGKSTVVTLFCKNGLLNSPAIQRFLYWGWIKTGLSVTFKTTFE